MERLVRRTAGREDEELSLAIYNEVWPRSAITFDEVESFKLARLRTSTARGVAGALKRVSIAWAKGQGYERLVTSNELRNEPIRRLNASLGYREEPGHVIVRGPLYGG